jgi:electron transport complex protein RnfB
MGDTDRLTRRDFLDKVTRGALVVAVGGAAGPLALRRGGEAPRRESVWQIDPLKCIQCGNCATECVLDISAVKCVHDFVMCGYCRPCLGFFKPHPIALDSGAENQVCPTGAIARRWVEDVYFEYEIDEDLCIGCAKCVAGCQAFGNGSFYLQVRHDRCLNCNECAIATRCPADAFIKLPADRPYIVKHLWMEKHG